MINFNRVYAMLIRYFYNMRHSFDRITDMFYWPAMDLLMWGLTSSYILQANNITQQNTKFAVIAGLVFWIIVWRSQYEITTNLLSELWDKNVVNIFAAPLKISEWIVAFMIFGLLKTLASFIFSLLVAFFLYKLTIVPTFGLLLIPIIGNLMLTGWAAGFFVAGFLIRYGNKIQTLAWAGVYLIAPFSSIYYSLSILPVWAQKVALFIPSTYMFEGIRELIFTGSISSDKLMVSFILNIVYLVLAIWFFLFMFEKTKKLGLGRLI